MYIGRRQIYKIPQVNFPKISFTFTKGMAYQNVLKPPFERAYVWFKFQKDSKNIERS